MTEESFIKFRPTDSRPSSTDGRRIVQAEAPPVNPYQNLELVNQTAHRAGTVSNELSIGDESFYNMTSNQTKQKELGWEVENIHIVENYAELEGQLRMNKQYQSSRHDANSDLPLVQLQTEPSRSTFQRFDRVGAVSKAETGTDGIQVAAVFYHLGHRTFFHRIDKDRNIANDLLYIMSFVYKKDARLVYEGLKIIKKLGEGPQKARVYEFIIASK